MKNLLLAALLVVAVFGLSDYFGAMQTLDAGCGCGGGNPNAKGGGGKRPGRNAGGCGGRQAAQPEEESSVVLEWEEASIETSSEDQEKSDGKSVISQFSTAFEQQKPIIVFVYTDNEDKKYEAKRKQCEKYMNDVLSKAKVSEELEDFIRVKIGLSKLDDKKLRKQYKLSKSAPFVAIYDFTGKQYAKTSNACDKYLLAKLQGCVKQNDKEVKKLEKKRD